MKKLSVSFSVILSFLLLLSGLSISGTAVAQSKKKQMIAKEKIEMDALALAFAQCKLNLLRYESAHKPNNKNLVKELDQFARIQNNLHMQIWIKYQHDENSRDKLEKKKKIAEKKLSVCIKYQNILDATANDQEKSKTDKKE